MASFKAEHLSTPELDYELKIRQLADPSLTTDRAKVIVLTGALKQASANRSHAVLSAFQLNFSDEVREIEATLADLKTQISSFVGSHSDVLYGRLTSRLGHVSGRVHLLESVTEEEDAIKKSLNFKILNLEGELEFKVTPQAHSTPHNPSVSVNSFPFFKSAPIHKWGVHFSGGSNENVVSFLEKIECLRLARGNSEDECFSSAGDLFKDSAFTWYLNNRGSFTSWQELVAKLKSDFLPYNYEDNLLDEIKSRKQAPQEKVTIFINEVVSLCKRLEVPLSESHIVRIIKKNLLPSYHPSLALTDILSIADLTEKCKRLEEVLSWSSEPISSVPSRSSVRNNESSYSGRPNYSRSGNVSTFNSRITCWNCRQPGHGYFDCSEPRGLFCYGCGHQGVRKFECEFCSGNDRRGGSSPLALTPHQNTGNTLENPQNPGSSFSSQEAHASTTQTSQPPPKDKRPRNGRYQPKRGR
ncbi:uncharacterized protein LOC126878990 [Diabrotica virgifera virgifera]|uniref:CCHC-type domain-containing protein n=1 Tax=Diabrotica virgifera virgifera TaxID=50390 RepID=A0ABM5JIR1_DIAVI|nr:uncharacterized protein LOC126878990 [Diabrotica virgifera virgifera]